jgi:hypothetical protein
LRRSGPCTKTSTTINKIEEKNEAMLSLERKCKAR